MQAAGRVAALVVFRVIPKAPLLFNPSHRHSAFVSSTVLRTEQHSVAGLSSWLPIITKGKHFAMVGITAEHSTVFPLTEREETERKRRRRGNETENTAIV